MMAVNYPETVKENIFSGFAETDIYLTNDIAAKDWCKGRAFQLLDKWNIAPRISLAYKFRITASYLLHMEFFTRIPKKIPAFYQSIAFCTRQHIIYLQYQKITNHRTFRPKYFIKNIMIFLKQAVIMADEVAINNNGYGDAKGIEFFWRDKKTIKNVDYWISYSYLDTKRIFSIIRLQ